VDPLPAGFEAVNPKLATSEASSPGRHRPAYMRRYRSHYGFSHRELRDDRFQAFANRLPSGRKELRYLARATTAGTFEAPPAHAEAMYEPDVRGRSAAVTVEVER
jgi:hypothetical protein